MFTTFKQSLAVLAMFFAIGGAQATPLSVNSVHAQGNDYYADLVWNKSYSGVAALWNVRNMDDDSQFLAFCIDPYQSAVQATQAYTASAFADHEVQALYDRHYDSALESKTKAIAFQIALWQLVADLTVSDVRNIASTEAAEMLNDVFSSTDPYTHKYTLTRWSNGQYQDILQALAVPPAEVPEPASVALMLAGLALMGLVSRRGKKAW